MSQWLAEKTSAILSARTSRRGFLVRSALAGSALAVTPAKYILRPVSAYAAICGCAGSDCDCGSSCCDGYTEFCCAVNPDGSNACPPGTFEAGWWRADGSRFCPGPRYYVDCNAQCGSNACSCRCAGGSCGNRRECCNVFRYGQCNTHIECYGAIACRVVTCTPPYELFNCDATALWDDSTANHSSSCNSAPPPPPPGPPAVLGDRLTVSHSGKALDVAFVSMADGAGVIVWPPNGQSNQRWSIEPLGDGSVRIGEAVIRVRMRDERCVMTTLSPDTGLRDFNTLRMIADYRNDQPKEVNFGVYATVVEEGEIAVGDTVEVVAET